MQLSQLSRCEQTTKLESCVSEIVKAIKLMAMEVQLLYLTT